MWKLVTVLVVLALLVCACGGVAGAGYWAYLRAGAVAPGTDGAGTPQVVAPPPTEEVAPSHVTKGITAYSAGDYEDALREFDAAVTDDPHDAAAESWRGRTYAKLEMIDRALPDLEDAAKHLPDDLETWRALGYVRLHSDDDSGAVEAFTHAMTLAPDDKHLYVDRANAKFHTGDRAGAVVDATTACDAGVEDGCVLRDRLASLRGR